MFDILVYVFENYLPDACPEPAALARKLSAAGFAEDEIREALDWLAGLDEADTAAGLLRLPTAGAVRIYDEEELAQLPPDCRGFLAFLEQAGAVDAETRELAIERALALSEVTLATFKIIVLMVLWRRQLPLDSLIFEELVAEEDEERLLH